MYGWWFLVKGGQGTGTLLSPLPGSLVRKRGSVYTSLTKVTPVHTSTNTRQTGCTGVLSRAVHAGSLPGPGEVGPVCDHVPGQVTVSGEVGERRGEGFTKQVLQVLGVLRLHPAREPRDTSLHVEQVGEGTGATEGQTTERCILVSSPRGYSEVKHSPSEQWTPCWSTSTEEDLGHVKNVCEFRKSVRILRI